MIGKIAACVTVMLKVAIGGVVTTTKCDNKLWRVVVVELEHVTAMMASRR
jgi:hypothetical protein